MPTLKTFMTGKSFLTFPILTKKKCCPHENKKKAHTRSIPHANKKIAHTCRSPHVNSPFMADSTPCKHSLIRFI